MKFYSLVLVLATLAAAYGSDLQKVKEVIECVRKGINSGIPEIGLPSLNPLTIPFKRIDVNTHFMNGTVYFKNIAVKGVIGFDIKELVDLDPEAKDRTAFNYSLYWDKVKVTGENSYNLTILSLGHITEKVELDITLEELHFNGTWSQTLGKFPHLDDFYLEPYAENSIDNSKVIPDNAIRTLMKGWSKTSFSDVLEYDRNELGDLLSPLILDAFNKDWIEGGQDRVKVLLDRCAI